MTPLLQKTRYLMKTGNKALLGLLIASALALMSMSPALADRDGGGWGGRGWGGGDHDGWRGGGYGDDGWRGRRGGYGYGNNYGYGGYGGGYQPRDQQPYGYAQPVYVPPPVYYPPRQSPGINLVFPLNFR